MDGEFEVVNECDWAEERIPDEDYVYRQVPHTERLKDHSGRRFPGENHFSLAGNEDSLSVNWSKYISPESGYKLLSLRINKKGNFVDYKVFKLFRFPVKMLRAFEEVERVVHSPIVNGNPAPRGKPNNRAHSSVFLDDDVEIRLRLSDYCRENNEKSLVNFKPEILDMEIRRLRDEFRTSAFHTCNWIK